MLTLRIKPRQQHCTMHLKMVSYHRSRSINVLDKNRITNFIIKILYLGYEKIVELLLKNGANVNTLDKHRKTALHRAANALDGKSENGSECE